MKEISRSTRQREIGKGRFSDLSDLVIETITEHLLSVLDDDGVTHQLIFDHAPTDDEVIAKVPAARPVVPTAPTGKAYMKTLLSAQMTVARNWEWFATKVLADAAVPAAVKTAVQAQADAEYALAKTAAQAWRTAT